MIKKYIKEIQLLRIVIERFFTNNKSDSFKSNNVCVVFSAFIGDFIINLDMLNALSKHYQGLGYITDLYIVNTPIDFAKNYMVYDNLEVLNEDMFITNKLYRNKMINRIKSKSYKNMINPVFDPMLVSDLIASYIKADLKIVAERNKSYSGYFLKQLLCNALRKKTYQQCITVEHNPMEFIKQEVFMKQLNIQDFRAHISFLSSKAKINLLNRPYCVVSPGASKSGKRWEDEKFSQLMKWLQEKYGLDIVLSGVPGELAITEKIIESCNDLQKRHIHNHVGKSSLMEYVEVIRNAQFVITNDSSPVHIAASTDTPSVCIVGGWDYQRLLPYVVHEERSQTCCPIYTDQNHMDCFGCYDKGVAHNNKKCKKNIKKGLPYCCIEQITVDEVKDKVKWMLGNHNE